MTRLFVRVHGLDRNVSREDRIAFLQDMFSTFIQLDPSDITIISDRDYGGFRNFMFVAINDDTIAQNAISALDNTTTNDGYSLNVNEAKPQEQSDRPRNSGGYKARNTQNSYEKTGGYSKYKESAY
jgi:RNA recognition motif-containing protein